MLEDRSKTELQISYFSFDINLFLYQESCFPAADKELLFGKNITVDDAFEILDKDGNNQV